jgi:hypothetical protein
LKHRRQRGTVFAHQLDEAIAYLLTSRLELQKYTDLFTGRNKITKTVDLGLDYYVGRVKLPTMESLKKWKSLAE